MPLFRFLLSVAALIGALTVFTPAAHSAGAAEQSCEFVAQMTVGREEGLAQAREIMTLINDDGFQAIAGPFQALPERYATGAVLEVSSVGDFFAEHFIVVNSVDRGNVYFRIIYEKFGDRVLGSKFLFQTDAEEALKEWPFLGQPTEVRC